MPQDAPGRVARIDDERGVLRDPSVIVGGMIGDDHDRVHGFQQLRGEGHGGHVEGVLPDLGDLEDVGIIVKDLGPLFAEVLYDFKGGGFPHVVDILLVGNAQDKNLGALEAFPAGIQGIVEAADHVGRHVGVDLAGELDEVGAEIHLLGLPGKVEGVDGDAMTAQPRAGVEGHEAEGFGGGAVDRFPDIDVHLVGQHLQLVDQGDVDAPERVLEDLGEFGGLGRAHDYDPVHDLPIEGGAQDPAAGREAAYDFRDVLGVVNRIAGVFALGGEDQEVIAPGFQAALLELGQQDFARGPGVGRALERDELALAERLGDLVRCGLDVAHVGAVVLVEGRGDADDDRVDVFQAGVVRGRFEQAGFPERADLPARNMPDVAFAPVELGDLDGVDIEPDDVESFFGKADDQGEADVAEADDADSGGSLLDLGGERLSLVHHFLS